MSEDTKFSTYFLAEIVDSSHVKKIPFSPPPISCPPTRSFFCFGALSLKASKMFLVDSNGSVFLSSTSSPLELTQIASIPGCTSLSSVDGNASLFVAFDSNKLEIHLFELLTSSTAKEHSSVSLKDVLQTISPTPILRCASIRQTDSFISLAFNRSERAILTIIIIDPSATAPIAHLTLVGKRPFQHLQFSSDGSFLSVVSTSKFLGPNLLQQQQQQQIETSASTNQTKQEDDINDEQNGKLTTTSSRRRTNLIDSEDEDEESSEAILSSRQQKQKGEDEENDDVRVSIFDILNLPLKEEPVKVLYVGNGGILSSGIHPNDENSLQIALRRDISCKIFELQMKSTSIGDWKIEGVGKFEALGHIAVGKRKRRFVKFCCNWKFASIVEDEEFVFVYKNPMKGAIRSPFQVLSIKNAVILAAEWIGETLLILTNSELIAFPLLQ